MCQRRQNSVIDADLYGEWKFYGNWKPSSSPNPTAMSE